jgi:hypothetical protein
VSLKSTAKCLDNDDGDYCYYFPGKKARTSLECALLVLQCCLKNENVNDSTWNM